MRHKLSNKEVLYESWIGSIFSFLLVHKIVFHLSNDGILDSVGHGELPSWNENLAPLTEEASSQLPSPLNGPSTIQSQRSWTSLGMPFQSLDPGPNILQETLKHETILDFSYLSSPQHLHLIWGCGYYCGGNLLSLHFHPGPRQSWSSARIYVGPARGPNEVCSSPSPAMSVRRAWMLASLKRASGLGANLLLFWIANWIEFCLCKANLRLWPWKYF